MKLPPHATRWALAALALAGLLGVRWLGSAREVVAPVPETPATPVAAASVPAAEAAASPVGAAPATAAVPEELEARMAHVRSDPTLRDRARQHQLATEADARWQEAVDGGGYTARDLDPAIREIFQRIDLEPRYAPEGRIEGLEIRGVAPDHPLARAGFRPGDRIDRIQGVELRDPADLPSLLARLGPRVAFCVVRDGAELCREIEVR